MGGTHSICACLKNKNNPFPWSPPTNFLYHAAFLLFYRFTSCLTESFGPSLLHPQPPSLPCCPSPSQSTSLPHMPCPPLPHPSLSLLHKLPVIDPGHISVVFPVHFWELQHPGPALMRAHKGPLMRGLLCKRMTPAKSTPNWASAAPGTPTAQRLPLWTET